MGQRLPATVVQHSSLEIATALIPAIRAVGQEPTVDLVACLMGHSFQETNFALWANSWGFVKLHGGSGDFFYFEGTGEILSWSAWLAALAVAGPRESDPSKLSAVIKSGSEASGSVDARFYAPHPMARFAGAATFELGAVLWLRTLTNVRYMPAFERAKAGDVDGYVELLKSRGPYFTAALKPYKANVVSNARRLRAVALDAIDRDRKPEKVIMNEAAAAWVASLPPGPGLSRDLAILDAVRTGHHNLTSWHRIELDPVDGRALSVLVSSRALRVHGVFVEVTPQLQQWIADELGLVLLTPVIGRELHDQADVLVDPITQSWWKDGSMALTHRMIEQSTAVDEELADLGAGPTDLVDGECKDWWLVPQLWGSRARGSGLQAAANGGWFDSDGDGDPTDDKPIQGVALDVVSANWPHDILHTDYSQGGRWAKRQGAELTERDGSKVSVDLAAVYTGPEHRLVGLKRPLPDHRHPGVGVMSRKPPVEADATPSPGTSSPGDEHRPELARGSVGKDVHRLRTLLVARPEIGAELRAKIAPSGNPSEANFGPSTEQALRQFQERFRPQALPITGRTDAATWAALEQNGPVSESAPTAPAPVASGLLDLASVPFLRAALVLPAGPPKSQIMIHTAEVSPRSGAAHQLARDCAASDRASWHYSVDDREIWCSVKPDDTAGAARGARHALHIELGTRIAEQRGGRWTMAEPNWQDAYHAAMLGRCRELVRALGVRFDIPLQRLTREQILAGARGVIGHGQHTRAAQEAAASGLKRAPWWTASSGWVGGTHEDPGPSFPFDALLIG